MLTAKDFAVDKVTGLDALVPRRAGTSRSCRTPCSGCEQHSAAFCPLEGATLLTADFKTPSASLTVERGAGGYQLSVH